MKFTNVYKNKVFSVDENECSPFCAPLIVSEFWFGIGGIIAPAFFKVGLLLKAFAMSLSIWMENVKHFNMI